MIDLETTMPPPFETLNGQDMDLPARERLKTEIRSGQLHLGVTRASVLGVRANRLLNIAVRDTLDRLECEGELANLAQPLEVDYWPEEFVSIEDITGSYVPLAYKLKDLEPNDDLRINIDSDWARRPEFISTFAISISMSGGRRLPSRMTPVKGNLQPLCTTAESLQRADLMRVFGRGVPWKNNEGYTPGMLSNKLTSDELERGNELSPDLQLALLMILAADNNQVAFFSEDGDWPNVPLLNEVASRLDVQPIRFTLGKVPAQAIEHILYPKYDEYQSV